MNVKDMETTKAPFNQLEIRLNNLEFIGNSPDKQTLFSAGQHRLVPGGKELMPGKIYVSDKRIILGPRNRFGFGGMGLRQK